jgi:Putative transposase
MARRPRGRASAGPYYDVVFILPAALGAIAFHNKAVVYDLLFRTAADPKHLGARIGLTAVLHTWGSALTHHPPVHVIVPGGGLSPNGASHNAIDAQSRSLPMF